MVFWAEKMKRVGCVGLFLLGIAGLFSVPVVAQGYGASITESRWQLSAGPFNCAITHPIPRYGSAILMRTSTKSEVLQLQQDQSILAAGVVSVLSSPPSWRVEQEVLSLGQLVAAEGKTPITLASEQLMAVITALSAGRKVVFSGAPAGASRQTSAGVLVHVALESRNFAAAYSQYQACITKLIPYSFNQLSRSLLLYSSGSAELSAQSKARLDILARYIKADKKVIGVIIDGHSDQLKEVEMSDAIAQLQAELTRDHLVAKGIAADMIKTRWHGDKFPVAANTNAAGRAKNRRVVVRFETETTRREVELKRKALEAKAKADAAALASSSSAASSALNSDVLERLVNMVEEQDLLEGGKAR